MTDSRLRQVVEQDRRLDVLCQIEREPQTVAQLSKNLGQPVSMIGYDLHVLQQAGVAVEAGEVDGAVLYIASLASQPAWVAKAVHEHRPRGAAGGGST